MFLSGPQIAEQFEQLIPALAHRKTENIKEACCDLRIGDEVYLAGSPFPTRLSEENPYVTLPPGQFALIKTYEEIHVPPDYVAFISIRFRFKLQGLTNVSGFHVDPTWRGPLIFSVHNVGPNDIRLRHLDEVFMIMWAELSSPGPSKRPAGPKRIPLEYMAQLGGVSMTISALSSEVRSLSLTLKIYGALASAALVGIVLLLLGVIFRR